MNRAMSAPVGDITLLIARIILGVILFAHGIQKLIIEMKEMNENIAHDLRSPITRIRGMAELTLTTGKAIDEYESAAAGTIEDCDRLLEMINTMLYISQTEATARKSASSSLGLQSM